MVGYSEIFVLVLFIRSRGNSKDVLDAEFLHQKVERYEPSRSDADRLLGRKTTGLNLLGQFIGHCFDIVPREFFHRSVWVLLPQNFFHCFTFCQFVDQFIQITHFTNDGVLNFLYSDAAHHSLDQ